MDGHAILSDEAPQEHLTTDVVLSRFGGEDGFLGLVDLVRSDPTRSAIDAIRKELQARVKRGLDPLSHRALDTLLAYRLGRVGPEKVIEAAVQDYWNREKGGYPAYNVLSYIAEYLPSCHDEHFRKLMMSASQRNPALTGTAYMWAAPSQRAAAFGLLLAHMRASGLTAATVMGLLRLAHKMSPALFAETFRGLWHMTPRHEAASGPVIEALGVALVEAGQHNGPLAELIEAERGASVAVSFVRAQIDLACERYDAARTGFEAIKDDPTFGADAQAGAASVELLLMLRAFKRASAKKQRRTVAAVIDDVRAYAAAVPIPEALTEELAYAAVKHEAHASLPALAALLSTHPGSGEKIVHTLTDRLTSDLKHPGRTQPPLPAEIGARVDAVATRLKRAGRGVGAHMLRNLFPAGPNPDDVSTTLNAYFDAAAAGDQAASLPTLTGISRVYAEAMAKVSWPTSSEGIPWPYYRLPDLSEGFGTVNWPKISVVIPSFNQRPYVEETILSLINQNYPKLEIIVFDAVSDDGTQDVLRRYEHYFDILRIEPDEGQSDAINKGMALATGDLLHWLNTDDMLCPGALHAIGATYAESRADVIAGYCIEVADRAMLLLNLPQADESEFVPDEITDLFGRWLRGDFFYQPEVFFTKSIWDKAGGKVLVDAHFTMDFEFWLRCAKLGAQYQRICAPIAFFRKHDEQKTSELAQCIDEQAGLVREKGYLALPPQRRLTIVRQCRRFANEGRRVAVVSKRYAKIFAANVHAELSNHETRYDVSFYDSPEAFDAAATDLIINLCHTLEDYTDVENYRKRGYSGPVVGWFWDNHHTYFENAKTARTLDIVCPSHVLYADYLQNRNALSIAPVPLCVTQWTRRNALTLYRRWGSGARDDRLYGGFVRYAIGGKRNDLILDLVSADKPHALYLLNENNIAPYFAKGPGERFADWCSYKASLCLPVRDDLSQRFFDAWLTGQIPVVPRGLVPTLEFLGADALSKHVSVFDTYSVDDVYAAHAEAVEKFNRGGEDGATERHTLARDNHMFTNRITGIIDLILSVGR